MDTGVADLIRALWLVFGAVVGACLGSFANVVIHRVPKGESVVSPRSRCPRCGTPIAGWHNIPVASWLALRGKARCCGIEISPRYMLVELVGAMLGFFVVAVDGPTPVAIFHGVAILSLVCVAAIDLDQWIIPRPLSLGLIPFAFVARPALELAMGGGFDAVKYSLLLAVEGAALGFIILAGVRVVSTAVFRLTGRIGKDEEAQGRGDEHLLAGIGAVLGPSGVMWTLVLAAFQGAAVGVPMQLRQKLAETNGPPAAPAESAPSVAGNETDDDWVPPAGALPFGPFLAIAAVEFILAGHLLPSLDVVQLLRDLWEMQ